MTNLNPTPFIALALLAYPHPADAKSADNPDEIIVSAMRSPRQAAETGSTVTIINAEMIAQRQYSFVADALRDAPGVSIAQNGAYGGVASIRIRGASAGQSLIVIDGIVMNDPSAPQGGFNFANLDLVDVDRIEVLRGPQSIIYGADAIGGVVSITTKKASRAGVNAFVEGGARATVRGGATFSRGDDRAHARGTISGIRSDGISRAAGGAENDGFRSIAASLRGGVQLSQIWATEIVARFSDSVADIDGFPPPNFMLADSPDVESNQEYAVAWRASHSTDEMNGALTISYNQIDRASRNAGAETFSANGGRTAIDYRAGWRISKALTLSAGAEFERIGVDVSGIEEHARNAALFGVAEIQPLEGLTLSAGARRDEFSNSKGATSPRVALAWQAAPNTILRASWGEGFRAPTLFELNYDQFGIVPNPDLRPERATGLDAGIEQSFKGYRLRATYFRQRVRDQIDFDFAGSGYFNIDRTHTEGVEVEADAHYANWLTAAVVYTFTDAIDENTGARLLRIPKHQGTVSITASPFSNFNLSASANFNGEEPDFPTPNDSFYRLDLRAAYQFSDQLEFYGRIENATGQTYQDVSGYAEPGVSVFGGIRIRR
ncbi:MAG: TonB-dependent receptor [Parvularculaceae bacterium]